MKFSVLLVTYNADLSKIWFTLNSVLAQRFSDYEIVISDDGSKDNHFAEITEYFGKRGFTNYTLVANEKNQGTVKNLIAGLMQAKGKYVRDFGPGDAFYAEDTMQHLYDFMESHSYEACFGRLKGYHINEAGMPERRSFYHPMDLDAYRRGEERILKNLILYSDHVSGAATCYTREYYLEYLTKLRDIVIYEEDIFQVLAALEGRRLQLLDENIVWYEVGEGTSTQKHSRFEELLRQDVARFYEMLYERFPDNPYVKKRKKLSGFYRIKNLYIRTILRFFANPDALRYFCGAMLQKRRRDEQDRQDKPGFLDLPDGGGLLSGNGGK